MNELLLTLGLEHWKPVLGALVLPPLPFLLLVLFGARAMARRRVLAWGLVLLGTVGIWLSCTEAAGYYLTRWLLQPPRALVPADIADLKRAPRTAIVVLGGGRWVLAPEYGFSTLKARTVERLRYGIWLARETGLPVAFSGGVGHGSPEGPTEAEVAARIAEREFGYKLRWLEDQSRDTRENAINTVALLRPQGIDHIVLVSHAHHMRRATKNFYSASTDAAEPLRITPAPLGVRASNTLTVSDWVPSSEGFEQTRVALHEWLGRLIGA